MKALIELHSELVAFHGYPVQVEVAIAAWHPRKEQIMLNRRSDTSLALYRYPTPDGAPTLAEGWAPASSCYPEPAAGRRPSPKPPCPISTKP